MTHVTTRKPAWYESAECLETRAKSSMEVLRAGGHARLREAVMLRYTHKCLIVRFGWQATREYGWHERDKAARHVAEFLTRGNLPNGCRVYVP